MFERLKKLFGFNRVKAHALSGNAVIGDVSGIVIQTQIHGPPPEPPSLPWRALAPGPAGLGIFNLLTWRSRLARTLIGREDDRARLLDWARNDPRPIAIRLLTGPGGAGKSRLAAEIADELRSHGWSTGLIALDQTSRLPLAAGGLFVAIDYPEANRDAVVQLLAAAGRLENSPVKIRLLLVSRQPMDWWRDDLIAARASELCDGQDTAVGPLAPAQVHALVREVAQRLAAHLGRAEPVLDEATVIQWHARDPALHGLPLFATAAAVHAVLDPAPTFSLAGTEIVEALVARERARLDGAAEEAGWPEAKAASRLHGLAALRADLDERTLRHLARQAPDIGLPPADRIVDAVEALGWWRGGKLRAPQPDLVAAELLHQILAGRPQSAPGWLAAALPDASAIDVVRLGRLIHDIATLHGEQQESLATWLSAAVTRDPALAVAWRSILDSNATGYRMAPVAIVIGRTLLETGGGGDDSRAHILTNLSVCLSDVGDSKAALQAILEAVEIRRRLALANPVRFEADLVTCLNNLSNFQSDAGDKAAALAAIREAVEISTRLARLDPARFEPGLALSLHNLSVNLSSSGDNLSALAAARQTVDLRSRLAKADPAQFEPGLASSLTNLSKYLGDLEQDDESVVASRQAVEIYGRLADRDPALYEPRLAMSVNNLAISLRKLGNGPAALAAVQRAVAIRRRVAQANPARFEGELALSLDTLANCLGDAGQKDAALAASQQSVEILRRRARQKPALYEQDLAQCLANLALHLGKAQAPEAAVTAIQQAVEIYERLLPANPLRIEPELALSLHNLCYRLVLNGDLPAALIAIRRAIEIRRRLVPASPRLVEPRLAVSLVNLAAVQHKLGDRAAALAALAEVVDIRRRLAATEPARFEPDLASALGSLALHLGESGEKARAVAANQEAVGILERLAAADPARFEADLERARANLAAQCGTSLR